MSDRTETIKPVRIDLGDGDSLNLYRMSDYVTVVRFHGNNPNVQLSSAQVSTVALRAALDEVAPAGSYTRTDEEVDPVGDAAYWRGRASASNHRIQEILDRAEKAERERDEARGARDAADRLSGKWQEKCEEVERGLRQAQSERAELRSLYEGQIEVIGRLQHAAESRPLTPDAITDEMVERAWDRWTDLDPQDIHSMRLALAAALTEPPARPEGAEEIEAWLDGMPESIRLDGDEHQRLFANHLAHMGFRVPVTLAAVGLTEKNTEKEKDR